MTHTRTNSAGDALLATTRPTTDDRFAALRALAEKATSGPWIGPCISDHWPPGWIAVCQAFDDAPEEHIPGAYFVFTGHAMTGSEQGPIANPTASQHYADAAYIAACDPDTIRALLNAADERDSVRATFYDLLANDRLTIDALRAERDRLAAVLRRINAKGGCGLDVHEWIDAALAEHALDRMAENARDLGLDY